jgi:hypothetical protein
MFELSIDDRLTHWAGLRLALETSETPIQDVWEFWKDCPFVPYNKQIDPLNRRLWPTPWEIIADNTYDDFTKALMIAWSLKITKRYADHYIEIKVLIDREHNRQYNVVCVENSWAINYSDNGPISMKDLPDSLLPENFIVLDIPR